MRPSILALFAIALCGSVQAQNGTVQHTGAMRNTMFNGQLSALVGMDSVAAPGVYGIGPLAFLRGELLVVDGRCYVATATSDSSMQVVERSDAGAPFFVQQEVHAWRPVALPDGVTDLRSLDGFLTAEFGALQAPFAFRMSGVFRSVQLHLVAVPPGTEVHGPADAHAHNRNYQLNNSDAQAIGFFSTKHHAVFTHHDTNIHVHAMTTDRRMMGHADGLLFDPAQVQLSVALP